MFRAILQHASIGQVHQATQEILRLLAVNEESKAKTPLSSNTQSDDAWAKP